MDRGRGSADQRNQATISHELQKYSRSRIGKGMNSRDGRSAGRWTPGSKLQGRDFAGGRRVGVELIAGERGRSSSLASGGGDSLPAADGRRAGQDITTHVRWRWHEVRECGRRGLALGIEGVHACLLGWAVSNGQIRIGRRTQYS
jgi:hypothetical protein